MNFAGALLKDVINRLFFPEMMRPPLMALLIDNEMLHE